MTFIDYNTELNGKVNMIELTPRAVVLLEDFFKDRDIEPIRIFVKLGGCGIRSFGIALEKRRKSDKVININGYTFLIDKKLLKRVRPLKIDADTISFRISGSGIQPNSGCGTCGFMCGLNGKGRCIGDCINCKLPCSHGRRIRAENGEELNLDT